jgi:Flp pilus assembly pilin Flp
MKEVLRKFAACETGAVAIEYAFIALIVGIGIIVGLMKLPPALNDLFNEVDSNM